MSLVFSAIVPHPPILIPTIGKKNLGRLSGTLKAYEQLEKDLAANRPDTIIVITPHGPGQSDAFNMNLCPEFSGNFEEFGDFSTKVKFKGDVGMAHRIRESLETSAPLTLISEETLDHGVTVPLFLLARNLPEARIIPLYYSQLGLEAHYKFGELLRHELIVSRNNIAVIASGDLSHRLSKDAPAGYSPKGKKFDTKLVDYLKKNQAGKILAMDEGLIAEAAECGLRSIVLLLGILDKIKHEPKLLSYEAPFGIGYLVMSFKL